MQNMQNDQSAQDARKLLVALSTNHPEARRASPFVGMDRPFSPSWADAEQAGLDRVRRDAATRWLIDNNMLEREEEAENQRGKGKEPPDDDYVYARFRPSPARSRTGRKPGAGPPLRCTGCTGAVPDHVCRAGCRGQLLASAGSIQEAA